MGGSDALTEPSRPGFPAANVGTNSDNQSRRPLQTCRRPAAHVRHQPGYRFRNAALRPPGTAAASRLRECRWRRGVRKFVVQSMSVVIGIGLLDPTQALADPVTVTSGHVTAQMRGGTFTLTGEWFSLTGAPPFGYKSGIWECTPCRASDRLNLSLSSSAGESFDDLPGELDHVHYNWICLAGHLEFTAGDMTSAILDAGQTSISMPFTFIGELENYESYASRATNGACRSSSRRSPAAVSRRRISGARSPTRTVRCSSPTASPTTSRRTHRCRRRSPRPCCWSPPAWRDCSPDAVSGGISRADSRESVSLAPFPRISAGNLPGSSSGHLATTLRDRCAEACSPEEQRSRLRVGAPRPVPSSSTALATPSLENQPSLTCVLQGAPRSAAAHACGITAAQAAHPAGRRIARTGVKQRGPRCAEHWRPSSESYV